MPDKLTSSSFVESSSMKIGAISKATGLGIHTIRFYEKKGLIHRAKKDGSGHRVYNSKDVELLNWIACMKNSGMPLSRIENYAHAFYSDNNLASLNILEDHLNNLYQQQADLQHYIDVTSEKVARLKKS
ncbi:MAG: MerR family transcriptional regulator [Paraglaciecola sp.]|uniref:MerR family transcriptional regulator n=1 Tax=Paraglaciecola sp. TaxID=1920173 RepID=UPI003267D842